MTIDFQQVREQVTRLGDEAPHREQQRQNRFQLALAYFETFAADAEELCEKVKLVVEQYEPSLRTARPVCTPEIPPARLNARYALPPSLEQVTILAADGSQINYDRHAPVEYGLINIGAILMTKNLTESPKVVTRSQLLYGDELELHGSRLTEARLALHRDVSERRMLSALAVEASPPVITLTDGSMELWATFEQTGEARSEFQASLREYLAVLDELATQQTITAGYVDKPSGALVVRLLEIACASQDQLASIKDFQPLKGLPDRVIFEALLSPGDRSAIFALQSRSSASYRDQHALHFFYLNTGWENRPVIARVDIPAWVAENNISVNTLHAELVDQCRALGSQPYPYALHRAHETALVTLEERQKVTELIVSELERHGIQAGKISSKQAIKDLGGRKRHR